MWFTRWLGCWCCSVSRDCMRLSVRGWDDLDLPASSAFSGICLLAVTGNFGFLARSWPRTRQQCWNPLTNILPVVIINGFAATLFMIGYLLFSGAMIRTSTLPRWSGVLVAVGAPAHSIGFRDSAACHYRRLADRDSRQRV